jgi:hypothetical protein
MSKEIETVEQFLKRVGRQRFQEENGRSVQLLTRAVTENVMPASWYLGVRDWCVRNKFDVPDHLFRWSHGKSSNGHSKQNVNSDADLQEEPGI